MKLVTRRTALASALATIGLAGAPGRRALALAPADVADDIARAGIPLIDRFGPVGTADDTATFNAAARSGQPFRLAARSYRVAGPVSIHPRMFAMYGIPGASRILCTGLAKGAWFSLNSVGVIDVAGVTWDGDGKPTGTAPGMVQVTGRPSQCSLRRCAMLRASGAAGLLISLAENPSAEAALVLEQIESGHNTGSGIWVEHGANLVANGLRLHDNGSFGLRINWFGNRIGTPVQRVTLRDSFAWRNGNAGFLVGTYNQSPPGAPAIFGPDRPDATDIDLSALFAWENVGYGVAVQGRRVRLSGSRTWKNGRLGGIVANASHCQILDCTVREEHAFGIDIGGSLEVDVSGCRIEDVDGTGLNLGGGERITGHDNQILRCTGKAVHAARVEYGGGQWLQYRARRLHLVDTTIDIARMKAASAVLIEAGTQDVFLDGLDVLDSSDASPPGRALGLVEAITDTIRIARASFQGRATFPVTPIGGVLTVPDIAATVVLPPTPQVVTHLQSYSMRQVGPDGIAWITVTHPGTGYIQATTTATLRGDGDVAAVGKLQPQVWAGRGGQVIGIGVERHGRGFHRAEVAIAGAGQGAAARAQIGLPIPRDRRLRLVFPGGGRLSGTLPDLSIGRDGVVDLLELNGRWIIASKG